MLKILSLLLLSQVYITANAGTDPNLMDRNDRKASSISPAKYTAKQKAAITKDTAGVASVNTNGGWAEVKQKPVENRPAAAAWGFAPVRVDGDEKKMAVTRKPAKAEPTPVKKMKAEKTLSSGFPGFTPIRADSAAAPAPTKKATRR